MCYGCIRTFYVHIVCKSLFIRHLRLTNRISWGILSLQHSIRYVVWAAGTQRVEAMRNWTTKEAKVVLQWAREPENERAHIDEIAAQLSRSTRAVQEFLRRVLPEGHRPWAERPRWGADEIAALKLAVGTVSTRSAAAIRQYAKRHHCIAATSCSDEDSERTALSVICCGSHWRASQVDG